MNPFERVAVLNVIGGVLCLVAFMGKAAFKGFYPAFIESLPSLTLTLISSSYVLWLVRRYRHEHAGGSSL